MKRRIISSILIILISITFSCKKDEPETNVEPTNTEIITKSPWHIDAVTIEPGFIYAGFTVTDGAMFIENCVKDNTYLFKVSGEIIVNEGETKCDSTAKQESQQGTWAFNDDETKMIFTDNDFLGEMKMESLRPTKFILSRTKTVPDTTIGDFSIHGGEQKLSITFIH